MQVMLIQDVGRLGRVGDVVEVKPGYARNYLIPQGIAVLATKGAIKQSEQLRSAAEKRRAREVQGAQGLAQKMAEVVLRFERKVGEQGRLYGSVTSGDIAERLTETLGTEIDRRKVEMSEPIKALGSYTVPIIIHVDVPAAVQVQVVGENGETAESISALVAEEQPAMQFGGAAFEDEDEDEGQPDYEY